MLAADGEVSGLLPSLSALPAAAASSAAPAGGASDWDQTTGDSHTSAAVVFSVGNGLVLTIATGASAEQDAAAAAAAAPAASDQPATATGGDADAARGGVAQTARKPGAMAWTGATVWGAAVPLARHLTGLDQDWGSTSVCELGCAPGASLVSQPLAAQPRHYTRLRPLDYGTVSTCLAFVPSPDVPGLTGAPCAVLRSRRAGCGLCGLAALALGAKRVVLTDLQLRMCEHNADVNFSGADRKRLHVQELRWGRDGAGGAGCRGLRGSGFDVILGSDLIYNISAAKAVAETMAMLAKDGTVVFLCNPETVHHRAFFLAMEALGFRCENISDTLESHFAAQALPSFRGRMVLSRCTMVDVRKGGGIADGPLGRRCACACCCCCCQRGSCCSVAGLLGLNRWTAALLVLVLVLVLCAGLGSALLLGPGQAG